VAVDLDLDRAVESDRDAVLAARVQDPHTTRYPGLVQPAVQLADAVARQIERD